MQNESKAAEPIAKTFLSVNLTEKQIQRFWRKVAGGAPEDCWNWLAYKNSLGYGILFLEKKTRLAHRIAYVLGNGPFEDALKVCHKCDNPSCCNPSHLWLGTDADNVKDRDQKGRLVKGRTYYGGSHVNSKLTDQDAIDIRLLYESGGFYHKDLAEKYGVSRSTIMRIVNRERWKHLP